MKAFLRYSVLAGCVLASTIVADAAKKAKKPKRKPVLVFKEFEKRSKLRRALPSDSSEAAKEFINLEFELSKPRIHLLEGCYDEKQRAEQTYSKAALIAVTDKDPVDVVIRRVKALIADLSPSDDLLQSFSSLLQKAEATPHANTLKRYELFKELRSVRRKIAFSNPLTKDIKKLLFIKREALGFSEIGFGSHMCDQYFGFHGTNGGKSIGQLCTLENPFSDKPTVQNLLADSVVQNGRFKGQKLDAGGFLSPEVSFNGKEILFSWTEGIKKGADRAAYVWDEETTYHIFKANADGSNLTMLTDGKYNDFDPAWLPNGRIVFISERRGGYGRCHGRPVPNYTLYSMHDDGTDIVQWSPHETNEWQPSIDNNGMVIYTRWDYVDRGFNQAHHAWITYPDGRDARAINGNTRADHSTSPNMEMDVRAIPGSHKYICTASPHHGEARGTLIMIDPRVVDDNHMSQLTRITPDQLMPETEFKLNRSSGAYASPWPLSEKYYICVYDHNANGQFGSIKPEDRNYGIYLVDVFGNKELLYRDTKISCLSPIPLQPRTKPPVIPHQTLVGKPREVTQTVADPKKMSTVGLIDVYNSRIPLPKDAKVKALRIWQVLPKTTPIRNEPSVQYGDSKSAKWVLGTVPVEEDGSAFWYQPAGMPVLYQAIDEGGVAIQGMRSVAYTQPGETQVCNGCHEERNSTPKIRRKTVLAMKREPSTIKPEPFDGVKPFSYARLVQPVLDANCVDCHKEKKALSLEKGNFKAKPFKHWYWFDSAKNLKKYVFHYNDRRWVAPTTIPGQFGARASKLYHILKKGHHGVELSKEDMLKLTIWMDSNGVIYGHEDNIKAQAYGEVIQPSLQ